MAHSFDHDRPEHQVHHLKIHHSHAGLDQKLDKGMRSPLASQLPTEATLESPQLDVNQSDEPASPGV